MERSGRICHFSPFSKQRNRWYQVLPATIAPCRIHWLHSSTDSAAGSEDLRMMRLVNNFWACQRRWFTFAVIFQGSAVPFPREQSFRVGICCHACPQLNTTARTKRWNINAPSCKLDLLAAVIRGQDASRQLYWFMPHGVIHILLRISQWLVKLILAGYTSWIMWAVA